MPRDASPTAGRTARLTAWLDRPVDNTFLALFRIAFGLLIALDMAGHFAFGFIREHFIAPTHHFTYYGFGWVQPWPAPLMYVHFGVVGIAGVMMALGWHYRVASVLLAAGFSYIFLIDQSLYLNHNYLISVLAWLMVLLPAHRTWSLDARQGRIAAARTAPQWTLGLLRAQIGIVYFFGGVAKINADWLHGEPLRMWLAGRKDLPVIGPLLHNEPAVYFFSYGGLLYDLFIVPLLLWRPTRPLAVLMCFFFHLTNATLFDIGIFPWMMLASTFLFFPPESVARWFRRPPAVTGPDLAFHTSRVMLAVLALHLTVQTVLPLRHWCYPGHVTWTEEGHRFSWRMKLRSKQGWLAYRLEDPATGRTMDVSPRTVVTPRQESRMATRPDMILQGAHWLADRYEREHGVRPRVYARAWCALNGRSPRPLIQPDADLAAAPRSLRPAAWITPFANTPVARGAREVPTIIPWREVLDRVVVTPELTDEALARILRQHARRLDRINGQLREEFGIAPEGFYILDGRTIHALTPRAEALADGEGIATDPGSLRRNFTWREHRVLASREAIQRYEDLATQKALLTSRLERLAAMAPDSVPRVELD